MHNLLEFGLMVYLLTIGLMAFLAAKVKQSYGWCPFAFYCFAYAIEGVVQFTVIYAKGNAGIYVPIYWTGEYIQDALAAWVLVDVLWRWKQWTKADGYILSGVIVSFLFPAILQYRLFVPLWSRDVPVYAMLISQAVWIRGLILKPQEDV